MVTSIKDPPDKNDLLLVSVVESFFNEMLKREGLEHAPSTPTKQVLASFLRQVKDKLDNEAEILNRIGDDTDVLEAFIKTMCIQLYEDYANQLKKMPPSCKIPPTVNSVDSDSTDPPLNTSATEPKEYSSKSIPPPPPPPMPPPPPPMPSIILGSCRPKKEAPAFKAAHKLKIRTLRQVNSNSLWALPHGDLVKEAHDAFSENEFQRLFCIPAESASASSALQRKPSSANLSQGSVICLLDTKRSNNISIALSKMKSVSEITALMDRVEAAELESLSEDHLTALIKSEPTSQEISLLQSFNGPVEQLNFPEKVVSEFARRPALPWMLRAVRYMQKIPVWLAECKNGLEKLQAAYASLLKSSAVPKLMLCARRLHELNNVVFGDARPVQGIAIEGVLEFARLESVDGKASLASYLACQAAELPKQLERELAAELKEAVQVDWDGLGSLLQDIQTGLIHLNNSEIAVGNRAFLLRKAEFLSQYADFIGQLEGEHAACAEEWKKVCAYFELDTSEYTPTDLFELWLQILMEFDECKLQSKA